ncbi:MAG: polymerase, sigma-24 subunit, subfamily [Thermoleophilia bacterium]|nr:polymerase, sigma-24 subunit, subfamily [Thermoleophilia bacterium]
MVAEHDLMLVRRAKAGDHAAFAALVDRHRDRVFSVARGVVGNADDAADVVQETWMAVLRHLTTFHEDAQFTTWLHRITVRKAYDHARRRVPEATDPDGRVIAGLEARDRDPQATGLAQVDLLAAIARLDSGFRDAVLLVDVAGLSVDEAAAALGVAAGTIKSRVFRGRASLAQHLGTSGHAPASD